MEIPVNVERVLLRAAREPDFHALLGEDRGAALADCRLSGSERAMLQALPDAALERMIDRIGPSRKNRFAGAVAAAVTGTLMVGVVASCDSDGVRPDDTATEEEVELDVVDGTRPDVPTDVAGSRPDLPDIEDVGGEDHE
jgi:hypothetical protein